MALVAIVAIGDTWQPTASHNKATKATLGATPEQAAGEAEAEEEAEALAEVGAATEITTTATSRATSKPSPSRVLLGHLPPPLLQHPLRS